MDSANKISFFFEEGSLEDGGKLKVHPRISLNKVGHALHWLHPTFRKITFDERVKEVAFQLNLQEPAVCQSMYIYKNPGIGSESTFKHNIYIIIFQMRACESRFLCSQRFFLLNVLRLLAERSVLLTVAEFRFWFSPGVSN